MHTNCCVFNYWILSAAMYRATARTLGEGVKEKKKGNYSVETPYTFFYNVDVSGHVLDLH